MITDDLGLSKTERDKLEKILLDFDEHWNPSALSDAFENLILEPDEFCRVALFELVKVDLHRHWEQGDKRKIDSYTSFLESIGVGPEIPPQLILAEFLARHSTGKVPSSKEYRDRFPKQFEEFRKLFEAEKSRRTGLGKDQASINTDAGKAAIDTKTEAHVDPNSLPETFGRYKIQRRLGAGAMGAVYLAHDTQLDRQVALKTPTFGGVNNKELIERFYREARAAANLRHPNICPVFDVGDIDGRHYITMAYIEGRPLSDYVSSSKSLEQKAIVGIIRKLALALSDAHESGVIHRDLKPANIMVDQKRQPLVMDFGLARREDELQSRMTQSGMILGTPAYMPPEQVKGKIDEIGPQADVYSLGIILYELLTGRLPFEGSVAAVIGQILTAEPKPPAEIRKDTDPALQAICLKMIAKELGDRYQSMKEVARDLADFLKGIPPSADIVPIDSIPVESVATAPDEPAVWTDPLALPGSDASVQPYKPQPKTKPVFWKTPLGRYSVIGAALLGVMLIAWSITLVFRTPYGTITITTDDPDLIVEVDGKQINIRDDSPIRFADGSHELALRVGDQLLPIGGSESFKIVGRDGEYRLSTNVGEIELQSSQFTVDRGENTALKIVLSPVREPTSTLVSASNPRTPLPDGPAGEALRIKGHADSISDLQFTPDGRHLVSNSHDKTVRVWDIETGQQLHSMDTGASCRDLSVSPNGQFAASCSVAGKVAIFDLESAEIVRQLASNFRGGGIFVGIDYAPDGKRVAAACLDQTGRVWDAETGNLLFEFDIKSPNDAECNIHYTPDGKRLLVAPTSSPGLVQLFHAEDGQWIADVTLEGHSASGGISILSDGRRIASGTLEGEVVVCDLDTRKITSSARLSGGECIVACSPDGRWIVTAHRDGSIHLVDATSLKTVRSFQHGTKRILSIDFSPDSRFFATGVLKGPNRGDNSVDIRVWRVGGEERLTVVGKAPRTPLPDGPAGEVSRMQGHTSYICGLRFTPDGKRLVSNSHDRSIRVWDVATQQELFQIDAGSDCRNLAISPIGKLAASCGVGGRVGVYDVENGKLVLQLKGRALRGGLYMGIDFSPDGKRVAAACLDKVGRVWNATDGELLFQFPIAAPDNAGCNIHFTSDGQHILVTPFSLPGIFQIFDAANGQKTAELPIAGRAASEKIALSPDGGRFVAGTFDGSILIYNLIERKEIITVNVGNGANCVDWSPDGRWIASSHSDGKIRIVDAKSLVVKTVFEHGGGAIPALHFSPDSRFLATGNTRGKANANDAIDIRIWRIAGDGSDTSTAIVPPASNSGPEPTLPPGTSMVLQPGFALSGHTGPIASLALASDGRLFASGSVDKTVCIWDSTMGRRVARIACPADVWRLNFAPNKTGKLAICCDDGSVVFWETDPRLDPWKAGKVARWNTGVVSQLETGQRNTIDVCFSPDGELLATAGDDGTAKIWNTKTLGMINSIKAHPDRCTVVRFTPDGRKLITGGKKGQARVWNVSDGRKLAEYTGHDSARHMVYCADVSPDGQTAVSAGNDGLVHLWQIATGQAIRRLKGHVDEVISVEFSADGRSLVSGSFDGTFRIWDVETGQQIQQGTANSNGTNIAIFGKDDRSVITAGGLDTNWKPVGQYSIRQWMRDGRTMSPTNADSTKDYDQLLTGQWVSWFDDLVAQANGKTTFYSNGAMECNDGQGWDMREDHPSRNAIIRVNIQRFDDGGQAHKPYLILRRNGKNSGYRTYLKGRDRIGVDKQTNGTWAVLKEIKVGRKLDDYFEWTMAMIEDEITVYIDGKQLLSANDPNSTAAGNTFFSTAGRARIKDMELMILDEAGERPPKVADKDSAKVEETNASSMVAARAISELNIPDAGNAFPSITEDGLDIFWTREGGTVTVPEIWTASRPNVDSSFGTPRKLFDGRHATVSGDGLFLVYMEPKRRRGRPQRYFFVQRNSSTEAFSAPRTMPDFLGGRTGRSPSISSDGRTLVFQGTNPEATTGAPDSTEFLVSRRSSNSGNASWSVPQQLELESSSQFTKPLTWPSLSDDELTLWFCHGGHIEDSHLVSATRAARDQKFGNYRFWELNGEPVAGRAPRYLNATGELYYSAPSKPLSDGSHDLWVASLSENREIIATGNATGWIDLTAGSDLAGWVDFRNQRPIGTGWTLRNGVLHMPAGGGGNIMTADQYGDFEMEFEWKIAAGGNSGVFYRARAGSQNPQQYGLEYQILDNPAHPNVGAGGLSGAIYKFPAKGTIKRSFRGADQWNSARIVARDAKLEHWLNGEKVAEVVVGDRSWNQVLRKSNANEPAEFGKLPKGQIVLQDHNSPVWFRNMRIRPLRR